MALKKTEPIPHAVVKWVGGKKQLLSTLHEMAPKKFNAYYEPFCGGAALYFSLSPKVAVLNDYNKELINLYQEIRDNKENFKNAAVTYEKEYNLLTTQDDKNNYYYTKRDEFNSFILLKSRTPNENLTMAALFLFLNKAGWNGVYRLNRSGLFNVPTGRHKSLNLFDEKNIDAVSDLLHTGTTLLTGDFSDSVKDARQGDFVFIDSPYYDTFTQYQAGGFSTEDHLRVAKTFNELTEKGVYCMLTNSNTDFIKDLYQNYHQRIVKVQRAVNRNKNERHGEEVIITNYEPSTKTSKPKSVDLMQLEL